MRFSIDENFSQTEPYIGRTIAEDDWRALKAWSEIFMAERAALFGERVERGKIRDCHGDLHTQNVYFTDKRIYVLDGIEFNRRFRYLDTTADLAFLLMDLDFRGFPAFANRLLNTYLQFTSDYHLLRLLDFYRVYRAYVRGKIASFEFDMPTLEPSQKKAVRRARAAYFRLARRYSERPARPAVVATTGLIGSGKSYIARRVAERLGAAVVRSDAVRKVLAGAAPDREPPRPLRPGIYSAEMTERVYEEMLRQARLGLEAGFPVVLDATYSRSSQRAGVARLAARAAGRSLFVHCGCHDEVIMQRLLERAARRGVSDAGPELLERVRADFEPPEEPAVAGRLVCVSSDEPEEERVSRIAQALIPQGVARERSGECSFDKRAGGLDAAGLRAAFEAELEAVAREPGRARPAAFRSGCWPSPTCATSWPSGSGSGPSGAPCWRPSLRGRPATWPTPTRPSACAAGAAAAARYISRRPTASGAPSGPSTSRCCWMAASWAGRRSTTGESCGSRGRWCA